MARKFENKYRLHERDDVLIKLNTVLQDLDLRSDAIEEIANDFKNGNRLDVDALVASINRDFAEKSGKLQDLADGIKKGLSADLIIATSEKRFTSDEEIDGLKQADSDLATALLSDLATKADDAATKAALATKADAAQTETALAQKANINHTHSAATEAAPGFMSAGDKTKLDAIASGANATPKMTDADVVGGAGSVSSSVTSAQLKLAAQTHVKVDGIGDGQQWVYHSQSANVTLQNTTGKPIMVIVAADGGAQYFRVSHNNINWVKLSDYSYDGIVSAIIPNGHFYSSIGSYIRYWAELR